MRTTRAEDEKVHFANASVLATPDFPHNALQVISHAAIINQYGPCVSRHPLCKIRLLGATLLPFPCPFRHFGPLCPEAFAKWAFLATLRSKTPAFPTKILLMFCEKAYFANASVLCLA